MAKRKPKKDVINLEVDDPKLALRKFEDFTRRILSVSKDEIDEKHGNRKSSTGPRRSSR
jgi:hypothetical protein